MKRSFRIFALLLPLTGLSLWSGNAHAVICTSIAGNGNWNAPGSWTGCAGGNGVPANTPGTNDTAIIATTSPNVITANVALAVGAVTVNAGGNLAVAGLNFTVNGATNVSGTLSHTNTGGAETYIGHVTINAGGVWDNAIGESITFRGGLTHNGASFTSGTLAANGRMTFNTNNQVIDGSSPINFVRVRVQNAFTVTNNNTSVITIIGTLDGTVAGSTWVNGANSTVNYSNPTIPMSTNGVLTATAAGNTFNYNGAAQAAEPTTYANLTLSGSGAKTFATTPTVTDVLSLEGTATVTVTAGVVTYGANATLQYNTATARTVSPEEWITPFAASGGVIIANTGVITLDAAKVFNASIPLTINNGASLATNNLQVTFGGDFIKGATGTFTAGSSPIVIANTMATQSIAGFTTTGLVSMTKTAGTATFTGNVNGAGLTINGAGGTLNLGAGLTHTFTGAVALTNGTLNGGSSTLNVNFAGAAWTGTGTNFTAGTSTVVFGAAGAQTLSVASTFNNLTFASSGLKTLTGVPTVNGIVSMEGTATVSAAPTYGAAASLQYNTATARNTGVEWITPFAATGGVVIANTGVITLNAAKVFNASVPLTINNGATLATGNFQVTFGGDFIKGATGTFTAGSSPIVIANTMATQSIAGFTTTGLVSMTKTAGTATFTGNVNGAGLTINGAGGTLDLGTGLTHTFTGTLTLTAGTVAVGGSTLNLNGPAIAGTSTNLTTTSSSSLSFGGSSVGVFVPSSVTALNNLTVNNTNGITLNSSPVLNGVLTLTSGIITTGANILEVASNCTTGISAGGAATYVQGNLTLHYPTNAGTTTCTFPIGSAAAYSPATIAMLNVTSTLANSSLTARTDTPDHADTTAGASGITAARSVNRYWTLTPGGSLAFATYNSTFTFVAGDIDGGSATASFIIGRKSGVSWSYPTMGAKNPTNTTATGMTQTGGFGQFVIGERIIPSITVLKTVTVYSDPVNLLVNPKFIPGAVAQYTVISSNAGGPADKDLTFITDPIPANTKLYVNDIGGGGSGPVLFTQGVSSSTLGYIFTALNSAGDDLSFSNDGGATFTATPTFDASGCDNTVPAITHIRIDPKGTFVGSAVAPQPSFQLDFRVCVK